MRGARPTPRRLYGLLAASLPALLVVPAAQAVTTLSLDPTTVLPAGTTTATGTEFAPGSDVRLHLDDIAPATLLAEVTVDRRGGFEEGVTIPTDTAPGSHVVVACEATGRTTCPVRARAALTVRAPPPPRSTTTATAVTITTAPPPTGPGGEAVPTTATSPTGPGGLTGGPQPTVVATTEPLPVKPAGEVKDLFATSIEVTQGIQDRDSHMPLVPLRPTFARVYVAADEGQVPGVRGILGGWVDGVFRGTTSALNQPLTAVENGQPRRLLESSLLFRIPPDWAQAGTAELELTVFVYAGDVDTTFEQDPEIDNNFRSDTVKFLPAPAYVDLVLAAIHLHLDVDNPLQGLNTWWPGDHADDLARILAGLERYLPVSAVTPIPVLGQEVTPTGHGFAYGVLGEEFDVDEQTAEDAGNGAAPTTELQVWKEASDDYGDAQWYGTLPVLGGFGLWNADQGKSISIRGRSNGVVAMGEMDPATDDVPFEVKGSGILAHEVGHNLGLGHYGCIADPNKRGSTIEELGGGLDADFPTPYPNCRFAVPVGPKGYYGLDVQYDRLDLPEPSVIHNDIGDDDPNRAWPLMSYGADKWADPFSYCRMLGELGATCNAYPAPGVGVPGPDDVQEGLDRAQLAAARGGRGAAVMVRGAAEANGSSGRLFEVAVVDDVPPASRERSAARLAQMRKKAPQSRVALVLRDTAGAELARYPLARVGPPVHGVAGGGFEFVEWLDVPEGLARVAVEWQGGVAEQVAGATEPRVEIVAPGAGTALDGPFTLEWRGQDGDGDRLAYDVLASPDGGRTWRVLARRLTGTSVALDTNQLEGSERARLRVRAFDGFHTAQADTGDLEIPDSGPDLVLVMSPRDTSTYPAQGLVVLSARASDLEDGRVAQFAWSSDRDGALGRGAEIQTRDLSPGEHRITVRATDQGGNTAEAGVRIVVDGSLRADVPDRATLARVEGILEDRRYGDGVSRLWALGGAALLLLGIALIAAPRRRAG